MLKLVDTTIVTLTGYPVDLAGKGKNSSDILCNKQTTFKDLLFDNCNIVGYKLLTCSGDSGGPLWLELNGIFFIIGIHHGGPERTVSFNKEKRNTSALITQEVVRFSENKSQN